jgi:heat shock protein HslJ/uncharacterized lipoprotein YbaY
VRAFIRSLLLCGAGVALAGCAAPEPGIPPASTGTPSAPLRITGQLSYLARIALPPDASVVVELRDVTAGDGAVVAEQRTSLEGRQVPIPFEVTVDRARLSEGHRYQLRGAVLLRGRAGWASEPLAVDVTRGDLDVGELRLAPIEVRPFASEFQCGETRVVLWPEGEQLRMSAEGQEFRMQEQVSASGARYVAADDPATQFWNKGRMATLELRGKRYPECVQVGGEAQRGTFVAPGAYRAVGNEPFWRLDLDEGTMRFNTMDGGTLSGARPAAETSASGVRPAFARYSASLDGQPVVATIYEEVCADTMSGMPHPNRVVVSVSGREYRGCGGEPARLLQGGEWIVEDIDGGGIIDRSRATLVFGADGRISGRASCNTYGGQYTLTGEALTIGKAAVTMMACAPSLDAQEQRFLSALAATQRFEITADGALLLLGPGDRSIKARRQ